MTKVIVIVGLPGSGKTCLAQEIAKTCDAIVYDDFSFIEKSTLNHPEDKVAIITDPLAVGVSPLQISKTLKSFMNENIEIRIIAFENNVNQCVKNLKRRNDGRSISIEFMKHLSKKYKPEIYDEIRPVWNSYENICLSGGAKGADLCWGEYAKKAGHSVIHFSFAGHSTAAKKTDVVILTEDELLAADEACKAASKRIKRWFPPHKLFIRNLLRRNWYQVKDAERVYAVASIIEGIVSGGTSWAVAMFIDRFNGKACECYVYDQITFSWFVWDGKWKWIINPPEPPFGIWAGIGSRELSGDGDMAMYKLLKEQIIQHDATLATLGGSL